MNFKNAVAADINSVFLNPDEFAETHNVEGKDISIIIDNEKLTELKTKSQFASQITQAEMLIYVKNSDLGYVPAKDSMLEIDSNIYTVNMCTDSEGMLEIVLESNY